MTPQSPKRQEENSSAVNLTISVIFHVIVLLAFLFFAAHEGLLGEKLEHVTEIRMVKEVKPPEPPKPKPPPPKVEPPKKAPPKIELPKEEFPKVVVAPKPIAPPAPAHVVAPPPAEMPSLDFGGGKAIDTSSDPVEIYKSFVEYVFHSQWNQPDNVAADISYETQVEVSIGPDGQISNPVWKQNSGDQKWSDSIQQVIGAVTQLDRPPPTNFPPRLIIIFNVRNPAQSSEAALQ